MSRLTIDSYYITILAHYRNGFMEEQMEESKLTKKDVLTFLSIGRKIVVSGAGAVLDATRSKIAELTDSEESFQRQVQAKYRAMLDSGISPEEARKAIDSIMKDRLNRAFEKCAKPAGDNGSGK